MSETLFPTTVHCPSCGEPAEQVWCDVASLGEVEPRMVPGELTCRNEACAYRVKRQAELDHIRATGHVLVPQGRGWEWWVGGVLVAITVALWLAAIVLWSRG